MDISPVHYFARDNYTAICEAIDECDYDTAKNIVVGNRNINLSQSRIKDYPMGLMDHSIVTTLDLNYNMLKALPDNFPEIHPNIEELTINGNCLEQLPDNIHLSKKLRKLCVDYNRIATFPLNFCKMTNLRILSLESNLFSSLPHDIHNLTNLEELNLRENQLTNLPDRFGELRRLKKLDLSYNQITSLPESFGLLTNLVDLFLCFNPKLESLGSRFGEVSNLQVLDVSSCSLVQLPPEFSSCFTLKHLDISRNQIRHLPDWVNQMPNIEIFLAASSGVIQSPFNSFGSISQKLKTLNLSGNLIESIPQNMTHLRFLKSLDLGGDNCFSRTYDRNVKRGNRLHQLPLKFGHEFCHLTILKLDECSIDELPIDFGAGLNVLETLDLHSNNLKKLPPSISCIKSLKVLIVSLNLIGTLPEEICELPNLQELNISYNQISYLPYALPNLQNLRFMDLSHNRFRKFPCLLRRLNNLKCLRCDFSVNDLEADPIITDAVCFERLKSAMSVESVSLSSIEVSQDSTISMASPQKSCQVVCPANETADEDWDDECNLIGHPGSYAPWYQTGKLDGFIPSEDFSKRRGRKRVRPSRSNTAVEGQFDDAD